MALGTRTLDNRIAFIATVNNLGRNREITDEQIAYYEARARGGTGLIITEGMSVHPTSVPNPTLPLAYDADLVEGLSRMADAVHRHDRPIYGQLWHVGRQALWNPTVQPWSPSGERDPYSGGTPHVMSDAEVLEIVDGFRRSAVNLQAAGFDGCELHGAHGYLINQFLSPSSNLRTDRWGGSTENRARFIVEIVSAIRAACGDDFGVGLKLTAHEYVDGGLDLEESQAAMDFVLGEVGLEFIAVSQANFSPSLEYHVADLRFPDVPFEDLHRGIHEAVAGRAPVMSLCKVPDVATASRLIDTGACELVGMARALIADPAIVNKVRAGAAPRPCIFCNICWEHIHTGRPAHCVYAPEAARELELERAGDVAGEADEPMRIAVLGAGPAGLEYARVAAGRGHDVAVLEAGDQAGGRFRREASVPGLEDYARAADWLQDAAREAGAELRLNESAPGAEEDFDLVVVATGSTPIVTPLEGVTTRSLEDALADPAALRGPVFVVDEMEEEPVYAAAEAFKAAGLDVHVITRRASVGRRVAYCSLIGVLRRLDGAEITVHTLLSPREVQDGRLIARHVFSTREHDLGPVGTLVQAGPYAAHAAAVADGPEVRVLGDASAPRAALVVIHEAHRDALGLPQCSTARHNKEGEPTHA